MSAPGASLAVSAHCRTKARVPSSYFATLTAEWSHFIDEARKSGSPIVTSDGRSDAREFIFETILENHQWEPLMGTLTAGAIAWLALTSPAGVAVGKSHTKIHYEITDNPIGADGRKSRNYRLIML